MYEKGQGILGKIRFKDGVMPNYKRTYLIIDVQDEFIEILNVSSIEGKEHKLLMPSNKEIKKYRPPFVKPSFVKMDSLTTLYINGNEDIDILSNGETLDQNEFKDIIEELNKNI